LAKATEFQPDVILADLFMPEMDGFELIRQVRQSPQFRGTLVIATSASAYEKDRQRSLSAGANAFLPKPVHANSLFEQLQRHLNLTWVYGGVARSADVAALPMIFPPPEEVAEFYKLSLIGDINELAHRLSDLAESDHRLRPFVAKMQRLLKEYRLDEMSEWLESHRKPTTDSEKNE
jgi:response regulator RpfG family c-di-GMP phosphodiesterase